VDKRPGSVGPEPLWMVKERQEKEQARSQGYFEQGRRALGNWDHAGRQLHRSSSLGTQLGAVLAGQALCESAVMMRRFTS
jgi:hypothetical protein